ncbi:expressed protein [Chlorella variabilis]|uniref:Expressed protein n=1 Tax=Chlorella variabilis TaxID=554065 RepID=E1Z4Z0_CHLVA|nr:expressed protein [Chlorella variabilis]EFN59143.1 expressed protein [Chlorella variabilis]|eukprot:XP_005851245.1 expressed protein [Chlorella variabilis]
MELHHRLRRDPSWHPSGCNICGQLGHQAAQCTTGTVNWRAMYGESAFTMQRAVFQSDVEAKRKASGKLIDFSDLEKRAKDYAQMREEQGGPPPQQAPPQGSRRQQHPAAAGGPPAAAAAAPPPADPAALEAAERKRAAEEGLPPGWSVAFDAQKKPYFWHKQTKKVQWDKPTADTPIN